MLGSMYAEGEGVPQDYTEAVRWISLAAEQGNTYAQSALGLVYGNGQWVQQDYVQTHMWLSLAAAKLHNNALKARDLLAKEMTPADISKAQRLAREWLEKPRD